jgi:predicted metal-binding protein
MTDPCDCCKKLWALGDLRYYERWNVVLCNHCADEWKRGDRNWDWTCADLMEAK